MKHFAAIVALLTLAPTAMADFTETPDLWTCGAQDWGPNEARITTLTDGTASGASAITMNFNQGFERYVVFPKWRNANWDLSGADALEFQVRTPQGTAFHGANPVVYLRNQDGQFLRIRPANRNSLLTTESSGKWQKIRVPLKPDPQWETVNWLNASLKDIDFLEIAFSGVNLPGGVAHGISVDDVKFTPQQPGYAPPNAEAGDLDVLIIERDPKFQRYDLEYRPTDENPNVERAFPKDANVQHEPRKGSMVTFTATVQNKGRAPLGGTYAWLMDGTVISSGTVNPLKPREKAMYRQSWAWDPGDHDLTFRITPDGEDYAPRNDALTIRTNALMLKFMIERGLIARAESKVNMFGSLSFEDWLQGQVYFMNQLMAESKYDFAPNGATARVMVGKLEYVDDGYIPTLGAGPFRVGEMDLSVDGGRGCTALDDPWNSGAGAPAFLNFAGRPDDAWLHELSHQIGIIDDYQFFVEAEDNAVNGVAYRYVKAGLMGGGEVDPHPTLGTLYSLYSPSNVHALNVTKGKRRGYFGEYLYAIPRDCSLLLRDEDGKPISGVSIKVFQTDGRKIDAVPEHEGKSDGQGRLRLKNRPAPKFTTETGISCGDNPFGPIHVVGFNGVFLVTARQGNKDLYGFVDIMNFNRAWASGHRDKADIPVKMKVKGSEVFYAASENNG